MNVSRDRKHEQLAALRAFVLVFFGEALSSTESESLLARINTGFNCSRDVPHLIAQVRLKH